MFFFARAAALAVAAMVAGGPALAEPASVALRSSDEHGEYVADAQGRSLYLFLADTQGKNGEGAMSACYDKCAVAWPPLFTTADPVAGEGLDASLLGTMERKDGKMQVTYGGWPLYFFVKDQKPGDTNGQDVEGFGEEWYLVDAKGKKVSDH